MKFEVLIFVVSKLISTQLWPQLHFYYFAFIFLHGSKGILVVQYVHCRLFLSIFVLTTFGKSVLFALNAFI